MDRSNFDLSIYLVTNSEMVPSSTTFLEQVSASIDNGATCIQLREKDLSTREFIDRAIEVKKLTDAAGIPLIINDRVDVALAVDAHLHVGQDDMTVPMARRLLGPDKIIGVSTGYAHELEQAIDDGADYVGIGICFDTNTKKTEKIAMGPIGAHKLLEVIQRRKSNIKTCLIGGINQSNVERVRYLSTLPAYGDLPQVTIDGVAVVSCVMASEDAGEATKELKELWETPTLYRFTDTGLNIEKSKVSNVIMNVNKVTPMVHHITNDVVKNFSANVTLAIGASPLMSECASEFNELASYSNTSLLLNTGTPDRAGTEMYIAALKAYNKHQKPIVYDPVGAGASSLRKHSVKQMLLEGLFTVIKGNAGEIYTAAGVEKAMRGVDFDSENGGKDGHVSISDFQPVVEAAKQLALATKAVVVVTGVYDIIVDGTPYSQSTHSYGDDTKVKVAYIKGGSEMMPRVTGTGCSLGSVIAAHLVAHPESSFLATLAACALYKQAGENAGRQCEKLGLGVGSFVVQFIDQLDFCSKNGSFAEYSIVPQ